jgi:hypothetical protein
MQVRNNQSSHRTNLNPHLSQPNIHSFRLPIQHLFPFHHVRQLTELQIRRPPKVVLEIALHYVDAVLHAALWVVRETLLADCDADDGSPGGQLGHKK